MNHFILLFMTRDENGFVDFHFMGWPCQQNDSWRDEDGILFIFYFLVTMVSVHHMLMVETICY